MKETKEKLRADLQHSEETLRATLKEATDLKAALDEHAIVAITDLQGRITFANDQRREGLNARNAALSAGIVRKGYLVDSGYPFRRRGRCSGSVRTPLRSSEPRTGAVTTACWRSL